MYDDILLPVDESASAGAVMYHAGEIAHYTDASVRLLYVADTSQDSLVTMERTVHDVLVEHGQDIVEEAGSILEDLEVSYETDVVQGTPASAIVDYAEDHGMDLVVMPTHAREGLSRYLLGSVTEKVVRLSTVPVLTARLTDDEQLTFPYERILLPTDGSDRATEAAEHGLALADALDAEAHLLSVVEDAWLDAFGDEAVDADAEAQDVLDALVEAAEARGVTATGQVAHGDPDEAILDAIEDHDAHAVVMGATGRTGVDRVLLGSVAEKTVRSAPVPVITVGGD